MSNKGDRHLISEAFRRNVFTSLESVSRLREKSYGPAEESFNRIAILWEAYWKAKGMDVPHTAIDVAMLMMFFKVSREMGCHDFENILDGDNYFAFAGGFAAANKTENLCCKEDAQKVLEEMFAEGVAVQEAEEDD